MESLKLFFRTYIGPVSAISDTIDRGNWLFAAVAVLVAAGAFYATVNSRLHEVYRIKQFTEFYQPNYSALTDDEDGAAERQRINEANAAYQQEMARRPRVPVLGDNFFQLFSFEPTRFYQPLLELSIFYIPLAILLMSIFGGIGSFGLILRRDYGTLAICTLSVWAAAHLPFGLAGILLNSIAAPTEVYFGMWLASGLFFGVLMVLVVRTVFGANYGVAAMVVCLAWPALSLGGFVFQHVSPLLFSPFLLFYAFIYLGGSIGGEVRGFGNALRQRQNFKRFLHNATVNPKDADAHVQLGLIYLQRRQEAKGIEHLEKAIAIDKNEIDANYEMGKLKRSKGDLQSALDHFSVVLEQDDRHALSEIWREVGATYLAANMLPEAHDALEKFVERRSADSEGLYYFGKVLKAQGNLDRAKEMFSDAVEYAKTSPDFRRSNHRQWSKLAQKEL